MISDETKNEIEIITEGIGSFSDEFWASEESDLDGEIISYPDDEVIQSRITALVEKASRLERIKTLEEVREIFLSNGSKITTMVKLGRLIEQAKSE